MSIFYHFSYLTFSFRNRHCTTEKRQRITIHKREISFNVLMIYDDDDDQDLVIDYLFFVVHLYVDQELANDDLFVDDRLYVGQDFENDLSLDVHLFDGLEQVTDDPWADVHHVLYYF